MHVNLTTVCFSAIQGFSLDPHRGVYSVLRLVWSTLFLHGNTLHASFTVGDPSYRRGPSHHRSRLYVIITPVCARVTQRGTWNVLRGPLRPSQPAVPQRYTPMRSDVCRPPDQRGRKRQCPYKHAASARLCTLVKRRSIAPAVHESDTCPCHIGPLIR